MTLRQKSSIGYFSVLKIRREEGKMYPLQAKKLYKKS